MLVGDVGVQIELPLRAEPAVRTMELRQHAAFKLQMSVQGGRIRVDLLAFDARIHTPRLPGRPCQMMEPEICEKSCGQRRLSATSTEHFVVRLKKQNIRRGEDEGKKDASAA